MTGNHEVRIFWSLDHGCLSNLQRCGSHGCGSHNSYRLPIPILGPVLWWQLKLFFWNFHLKNWGRCSPNLTNMHIFQMGWFNDSITSYKKTYFKTTDPGGFLRNSTGWTIRFHRLRLGSAAGKNQRGNGNLFQFFCFGKNTWGKEGNSR